MSLTKWFDEKWVDISRPKRGGGYESCGRKDASEGKYPKCLPAAKAARLTETERESAVRRKRIAERKMAGKKGGKPVFVPTKADHGASEPTNAKLYAQVKSAAKKKFDVYPSAYANGWLVQEYKRRGGSYSNTHSYTADDDCCTDNSHEYRK